jgi:hypothetical protein
VPIDNAHSNSYGITERDSYCYPYTYCNTDANRDTYAYADTNSDATTTDTYAYSNCNCYTNANTKPIWQCMPAANDGEPYSCSQHAVQFHGTSKRH